MLPTLRSGQMVVLTDMRTPQVGDIVMIRHRGIEKIKRISRVKADKVYLLGDNPAASTDSRDFGWLEADAVIAKLRWPR